MVSLNVIVRSEQGFITTTDCENIIITAGDGTEKDRSFSMEGTNGFLKTFTMRNTGIGALTVSLLSAEDVGDFTVTDSINYPLSLTNSTVQFTVNFNPSILGDFTTNPTIMGRIKDITNGRALVVPFVIN